VRSALRASAELVPLSRTAFFRACLAGDRTFAPWPGVYHPILRLIRCGYCVYGYLTTRVELVEEKTGDGEYDYKNTEDEAAQDQRDHPSLLRGGLSDSEGLGEKVEQAHLMTYFPQLAVELHFFKG